MSRQWTPKAVKVWFSLNERERERERERKRERAKENEYSTPTLEDGEAKRGRENKLVDSLMCYACLWCCMGVNSTEKLYPPSIDMNSQTVVSGNLETQRAFRLNISDGVGKIAEICNTISNEIILNKNYVYSANLPNTVMSMV